MIWNASIIPQEMFISLLTCICLRQRLLRVTLEISRTAPWYRDITAGTLTATDTCIGITWRGSKLLETLTLLCVTYAHVWARVAGWVGEEEKHTYCCYAYRLYFLTCDMYKSSQRHIHDLVLSLLKMKGMLSFVLFIWRILKYVDDKECKSYYLTVILILFISLSYAIF
jgi:hypothetical protein